MSFQTVLRPPSAVPRRARLAARLAVGAAKPLTYLPPHRIRRLLTAAARGARPAAFDQTQAARDAVTTVSLVCAGREGCLQRSIATALLCRARGVWPTWCVGIRSAPPFAAHAWVETDGRMVGEGVPDGYFRVLFSVAPHATKEGTDGRHGRGFTRRLP
ncbi:lasso peptide biosynthesis B2 protein [Streptomyces montanus]|uniref:Lasso peptide biosynthesis B2 protein n=1 Tax=Streptomyces montanus TaxID=2580423 RepID=A0A5R9FT90_9ACTN|nr:lasso peptide biosynthesis B2 protein [Streptomyces montanus]TLS43714.1 lasso peptide biosynthesis B2 protein [Streptomyces montanus]